MPEVRSVRAELDDLDALAPLFDAYRQFYGEASDLPGARIFLGDRLKRGESVIFLAVVDRAVVGFTQLYPSFSSVSMKRLWVLNDLFVTPDARTSGAGRALLERYRNAFSQGYQEAYPPTDAVSDIRVIEGLSAAKPLAKFGCGLR